MTGEHELGLIREAWRSTIPRVRRLFRRHRLDAVFWGLFAFAALVGGEDALLGLASVVKDVEPGALLIAQASPSAETAYATFSRPGAALSKYRPRVLQPVVAQEVPDWLLARRPASERNPLSTTAAQKIAIVIDDLGQDVAQARRAITLPQAISLSFLPYPPPAPRLAREARLEGHETLVHVPMEPVGTADPGPHALETDLPAAENLRRLKWDLNRFPGFDGINNHEGSKFTADRAALAPVMNLLFERHLFFLDSRTSPNTQGVSVAREYGVESADRDVFLDDLDNADAIDVQLRLAEKVARDQGVAIAIGHPRPNTLDALWRWCGEIHSRGYVLIPVREAIELKAARGARQASLERH